MIVSLQETGQLAVGVSRAASGSLDPASRAFWCALGNLYTAARTDLMRLGHAAALRPDVAESPMLLNVRPSFTCFFLWLWHMRDLFSLNAVHTYL